MVGERSALPSSFILEMPTPAPSPLDISSWIILALSIVDRRADDIEAKPHAFAAVRPAARQYLASLDRSMAVSISSAAA